MRGGQQHEHGDTLFYVIGSRVAFSNLPQNIITRDITSSPCSPILGSVDAELASTMARNEYELVPEPNTTSRTRLENEDELLQRTRKVSKQREAGYVTRLTNWCASLFDTKPYQIKEEWGTTVWHMSKRLLTLCILVGYVLRADQRDSADSVTIAPLF